MSSRRLLIAWTALGIAALLASVSCGGEPETRVTAPRATTRLGLNQADASPVVPFSNVAATALRDGYEIWNDLPGVVVFDYDRDGDMDLYITAEAGHANWLYRNDGSGSFTDVADQAGVKAVTTNTTGAVACDFDNDGYQDLYVGAWGNPRDGLGFRSPSEFQGNSDLLFINNQDGSFRDVTDAAFGGAVNIRSATTVACADVDGDGWLDIYVGNLADDDFINLQRANHPGHYNMLYRNRGDLTFVEVAEQAGVQGPQVAMRDTEGEPILFRDPESGEQYEGYDPTATDQLGNRVGEPTGQTHSVAFFDYDDDGDPDLWVANDGDRLHVYRNDSSPGLVRFVPVARAMGIDKIGAWMGFAVGDYDGDADLDVFVTNIGYHLRLIPPQPNPGGSCGYHESFNWGTCLHFLLRNDGTREVPGLGPVGRFPNVAWSTEVAPSPIMPPHSLDPDNIHPANVAPTGLAAYDFGFGATFFDHDNDGDQDLYWLGSTDGRGEGPEGGNFEAAGRMLRRHGSLFEDITVRAHLLDISSVDYGPVDSMELPSDLRSLRISAELHEDGKGVAHGDLNGDGYVDLVGTNASGPLYANPTEALAARAKGKEPTTQVILAPGPVFVWMNGGGENHWITIRLKGRMAVDGTGSNADGIGARVYVKTEPNTVAQVQEARAGSSYLSMSSIDLEFGLGSADEAAEITVIWPSGTRQVVRNVPADQVLTLTEPAASE